jgi:hypothetical protein
VTLMAASIKKLLGDKAYDSNSFRSSLRNYGITPGDPAPANHKKRIRHDMEAYKGQCHRALFPPAQGFQAHCHTLRQARKKLSFQCMPGCNPGILDVIELSLLDPSVSRVLQSKHANGFASCRLEKFCQRRSDRVPASARECFRRAGGAAIASLAQQMPNTVTASSPRRPIAS